MLPPDDDQKRCGAAGACPAPELGRRRFLSIAGSSASAVLLAGTVPACGASDGPPFGKVAAGNVSALPVGKLLVMGNLIVARDAGGLYAMTAICTHMGCIVRNVSQSVDSPIHCPCHGSMYDGNGAVTQGPAPRPLQHYAVTVAADGTLTVDGGQPVSAETRTPVV